MTRACLIGAALAAALLAPCAAMRAQVLPAPANDKPTLATLLNDGYAIVTGLMGNYVLRSEDGKVWVECNQQVNPDGTPGAQACKRLN